MTDRTTAGGEQGLLDLAFSPDGSHLYVSYTNNDGDSASTSTRCRPTASTRPPGARCWPSSSPSPTTTGAASCSGRTACSTPATATAARRAIRSATARSPTTLLAKLLRIDPAPDGNAALHHPPDNPFASGGDARPEIWSTGLRNPWRFSFDAATGDLWIGDVGQNAIEEIDHVPAADGAGKGTNFGWSAYEGSARYNDDQDAPDSVDAGLRVPARRRRLLGDRRVRVPRRRPSRPSRAPTSTATTAPRACGRWWPTATQVTDHAVLSDQPGQVVSFGTDAKGELYVVSLGGSILPTRPRLIRRAGPQLATTCVRPGRRRRSRTAGRQRPENRGGRFSGRRARPPGGPRS